MGAGSWRDEVPEAEQRVLARAGFGTGAGRAERPALIVVDVTFDFTGSRALSREEAMAEFATAAGPVAWEAMPRIAALLAAFRAAGRPVAFTRTNRRVKDFLGRATTGTAPIDRDHEAFNRFPEEIAPGPDDCVIEKNRASAFFGTPLSTYLVQRGVRSVVFAGVSTSGCVRASVVDAFSHGFDAIVAEDAVFDRSRFAHVANLFDMAAKYAQVLSAGDACRLIAGTSEAGAG